MDLQIFLAEGNTLNVKDFIQISALDIQRNNEFL